MRFAKGEAESGKRKAAAAARNLTLPLFCVAAACCAVRPGLAAHSQAVPDAASNGPLALNPKIAIF